MIIPNDFIDFDMHPVTMRTALEDLNHNDCNGEHFNEAWFRLKEIELC